MVELLRNFSTAIKLYAWYPFLLLNMSASKMQRPKPANACKTNMHIACRSSKRAAAENQNGPKVLHTPKNARYPIELKKIPNHPLCSSQPALYQKVPTRMERNNIALLRRWWYPVFPHESFEDSVMRSMQNVVRSPNRENSKMLRRLRFT